MNAAHLNISHGIHENPLEAKESINREVGNSISILRDRTGVW